MQWPETVLILGTLMALGTAAILLATALSRTGTAQTRIARLLAQQMVSRDAVVMDILREADNLRSQVVSEGFIATSLQKQGLLPMMLDPQSRLFHEIETIKEVLGCDEDTARTFLLRSVLQSGKRPAETQEAAN